MLPLQIMPGGIEDPHRLIVQPPPRPIARPIVIQQPSFLTRMVTGVRNVTQFGLSGGVAGNTNVTLLPGGVAITTGRNGYGNAFHRVVTNPLISPAGAFINWLTR